MKNIILVDSASDKLFVYTTMSFGDWLRSQINERGWSNAEFARRTGMSPTYIGDLIRGHKKDSPQHKVRPSEKKVVIIAKVLGQKLDDVRELAGYVRLSKKLIQEQSVHIGKGVLLVFPEQCKVTELEKQNLIILNRLAINGLLAYRLIAEEPEMKKNFLMPKSEPAADSLVMMQIQRGGDVNKGSDDDGEEQTEPGEKQKKKTGTR